MADHDVDLFVVGAGSGGVRAARIAASHAGNPIAGLDAKALEDFDERSPC